MWGALFWMQATGGVWVLLTLQGSFTAASDEWKGSVNAVALLEVQATIQLDLMGEAALLSSSGGMRPQQPQEQVSSYDSITQTILQEAISQRQWVLQVHELLFADAASTTPMAVSAQTAPSPSTMAKLQEDVLALEWEKNVALSTSKSRIVSENDNDDSQILLSSLMGTTTVNLLFPLESQDKTMTQQSQSKRTRTLLVKLLERRHHYASNNKENPDESFRFLKQQLVLVPRIQRQLEQPDEELSLWWRPYTRMEMHARSVFNLSSSAIRMPIQQQQQRLRRYHSDNYTAATAFLQPASLNTTTRSSYWNLPMLSSIGVVVVLILILSGRSLSNDDDDEDDNEQHQWGLEEEGESDDEDDEEEENESYSHDEHEDASSEEQLEHDSAAHWDEAGAPAEEERLSGRHYDTANWGECAVQGHAEEQRRPSSLHAHIERNENNRKDQLHNHKNDWQQFDPEGTVQWGNVVSNSNDDRVEEQRRSNHHGDRSHWGEAVVEVNGADAENPFRHSSRSAGDDGSTGLLTQVEREITAKWGDLVMNDNVDRFEALHSNHKNRAHSGEALIDVGEAEKLSRPFLRTNTAHPRQAVVDGEEHVQNQDEGRQEQIGLSPPTTVNFGQGNSALDAKIEDVDPSEDSRSSNAVIEEKQLNTVDTGEQIDMPPTVERCKLCPEEEHSFMRAMEKSYTEHQANLAVKRQKRNEFSPIGTEPFPRSKLADSSDEIPPINTIPTRLGGACKPSDPTKHAYDTHSRRTLGSVDSAESTWTDGMESVVRPSSDPSIEWWQKVSIKGHAMETSLSSAINNKSSCISSSAIGVVEALSDNPLEVALPAVQQQPRGVNDNRNTTVTADTEQTDEAGSPEQLQGLAVATESDQTKGGRTLKMEASQGGETARERGSKRSRAAFEKGVESNVRPGDRDAENSKSRVASTDEGETTHSRERNILRRDSSGIIGTRSSPISTENLPCSEIAEDKSPNSSYTSSLASDSASSEERLRRERHHRVPSEELMRSVMARFSSVQGTNNAAIQYEGLLTPHAASSKENVATMTHRGQEVTEESLNAAVTEIEACDDATKESLSGQYLSLDHTGSENPLSRSCASRYVDHFRDGFLSPACAITGGKVVAEGVVENERGVKGVSAFGYSNDNPGAAVDVGKPKLLEEEPNARKSASTSTMAVHCEDAPVGDDYGEKNALEDLQQDIPAHAASRQGDGEDAAALYEPGIMQGGAQRDVWTSASTEGTLMAAELEVDNSEAGQDSSENMMVNCGDADVVVSDDITRGKESAAGKASGEDATARDAVLEATMSTNAASKKSGTHFAVKDKVGTVEFVEDATIEVSRNAAPFEKFAAGAHLGGDSAQVEQLNPTFDGNFGDTATSETTKKELQQSTESNVVGALPGVHFSTIGQGRTAVMDEPGEKQPEQPSQAAVEVLPDIVLSKSLLTAAETIRSDVWEFGEGTQPNPFNLTGGAVGLRSAALRRARRSVSRSKALESSSSSSMDKFMRVTRSRTKREREDGTKSGTRSSRRNRPIPEKDLLGVTIDVGTTARLPRRKHAGPEAPIDTSDKTNMQTTGRTVKQSLPHHRSNRIRMFDSPRETIVALETAGAAKYDDTETTNIPIEVTSSLSKSLRLAAKMMEAPTWSLPSGKPAKVTFPTTIAEHMEKQSSSSTTLALANSTAAAATGARKPLSPIRRTNVWPVGERKTRKKDFSTRWVTPTWAGSTNPGKNTETSKKRPLRSTQEGIIDLSFSPDQGGSSAGLSSHDNQATQPALLARPSLQQNRPIKRLRRFSTTSFELESKND